MFIIQNAKLPHIYHELCTFLYEGGFIVLLITLTAYGGTSEIAPIANTLHRKPLLVC